MNDHAINIRCLEKGEERLWHSCGLNASTSLSIDDLSFTADSDFRPEAFVIALRDGAPAGRMQSLIDLPRVVTMVDPIVIDGSDPLVTAHELLLFGIDALSLLDPSKIELIVQSRLIYSEALVAALPGWGFEPRQSRQLYQLTLTDNIETTLGFGDDILVAPVKGHHDPELHMAVMDVMRDEPGEADEVLADIAERAKYSELWLILLEAGEPIGYILPELFNDDNSIGSVIHIGVRPQYRQRGFGAMLQREGLRRLRNCGVRTVLDATDLANAPMRRILEKLGYAPLSIQYYFEYVFKGKV
ncbi:N-acetyltransferase family protein [Rhizobium ruizarguesonis]